MVFKDALLISFFFDADDPDEVAAFAQLQQQLDTALRSHNLGRFDGAGFDPRSHSHRIELAGHDADTMLQWAKPLIAAAGFPIGPKATLISRSYNNGVQTQIRHVDLD